MRSGEYELKNVHSISKYITYVGIHGFLIYLYLLNITSGLSTKRKKITQKTNFETKDCAKLVVFFMSFRDGALLSFSPR